jgi:hypothetical protein
VPQLLVAITHDPSSGWGQVGTVLGESYGEFDIYFSLGDPPVRYVAVWDASCDGYGGVDVDAGGEPANDRGQ